MAKAEHLSTNEFKYDLFVANFRPYAFVYMVAYSLTCTYSTVSSLLSVCMFSHVDIF